MKSEKKRTLKENIAMIVRGYKIIFKIAPKYMTWSIIRSVFSVISPYFSLYMSALVISELAYSRDINRLLMLAGITVGGLFLLNVVNRILKWRFDVYASNIWRATDLFFLREQSKMQYEHLEDPDVALLRAKIRAERLATGSGLHALTGAFGEIVSEFANLIASISLTVSLFTVTAQNVAGQGAGGLLAFINSPLASVALIALILLNTIIDVTLQFTQTRKVRAAWYQLADKNTRHYALGRLWGSDTYIFNMHKIILREDKRLTKDNYFEKATQAQIQYDFIQTLWNFVMTAALFVFVAGKAYVGAIGIGSFILYRGTVKKFVDAFSHLSYIVGSHFQNNDSLEKTFRYLDLPNNMYKGTLAVEKRDDLDYEIEFRDVGFRYPRSDTWALRHVSVKFKIGERLAVVGMNGSGKTTFIKLLCRLYDPTEGQILLNGIDITRYRYDEYLSIFSVVFQDYKLFSFPIAENVSAALDYDKEKVLSCLERVGLGDRIRELDRGIETPLHRDYENDGIDISGGEAQKLAIARALYKDAPFIILDEPTAALDPVAEAEIYDQFNKIVDNKTAIYISHRLSSCRFCDRILVFHDGTIIQRGTHETLLSDESGKYHELWHAQAQYYTE